MTLLIKSSGADRGKNQAHEGETKFFTFMWKISAIIALAKDLAMNWKKSYNKINELYLKD